MFTIQDIKTATRSDGTAHNVPADMVKHFKAGANASWSRRWAYDLGRAEDWYESKHGERASDYFADGWCWGASQ